MKTLCKTDRDNNLTYPSFFAYLLFQLHFFCCLRANLALSKEKHLLASFSQMLLQLHPRHLQKSKKSEYWPLDAPGTCSWVFEGSMDGSAGAPSYWEAVAHLKEWVKPFHDLKAISYSKEGILPEDGINTFGIQIFKKDHLCFSCRTYSFYYNSKNYVSFWKLFKRASNVFQFCFCSSIRLGAVIKRVKKPKKPFCKTIEKQQIHKNSSVLD